MQPEANDPQAPSFDPSTRPANVVDTDFPCGKCGYNLVGLPTSGKCPECAADVGATLSQRIIAFADTPYLKAVTSGILLLAIGLVAQLVLQLVAGVLGVAVGFSMGAAGGGGGAGGGPPVALMKTIALAGFVPLLALPLICLGYWKLASPSPQLFDASAVDTSRKLIRVGAVLLAVGMLVQTIATYIMQTKMFSAIGAGAGSGNAAGAPPFSVAGLATSVGFGLVTLVAWIMLFFATMEYIRWIARRIPDEALFRSATNYRWVLPLIYILGSCCVVGPLVAMIMYLLLLWKVRKHMMAVLTARGG